jgi:hypothetical protein
MSVLGSLVLGAAKTLVVDVIMKVDGWYKRLLERRHTFWLAVIAVVVPVVDMLIWPLISVLDAAVLFADEALVAWLCIRPIIELTKRLMRHVQSRGGKVPEALTKALDQVEAEGDKVAEQATKRVTSEADRRLTQKPQTRQSA